MTAPLISVVIPTCNRRDAVRRLLRALANDATAPAFEVIVVVDGSTDDTAAQLREVDVAFPLAVLSQPSSGPACARNTGARKARGRVLLFLDDDVEPVAGTLAAHAALHATRDDMLGIGDLPPAIADETMFGIILRGWWEMMLHEIRKPGHRFGFRNVLTGHLSIRRASFDAVGGFDPELRCHEDWEFGYRAMNAGMQLQFVAGAAAHHHETSNLAKVLRRKFDEGVADVQLMQRHPELGAALPLMWLPPSRKARLMRRLAWHPAVGNVVTTAFESLLPVYEFVKLRSRWRATLELLLTYWYWRGVATMVANRRATATMPASDELPELFIDLARGLTAAEKRLDALTPSSAALFFGERLVGVIPATPGLEPLRGEHLRPLLSQRFRWALRQAVEASGTLPEWLQPPTAASTYAGAGVPNLRPPTVRDEHLPASGLADVNVEHRPAVPPVHHVA